jgi:glycine cleavage system H protein
MNIPDELKYTQNDEWIKVEDNTGTIGITDYAQDQLSDIVYFEALVSEGETIEKGDSLATVESVKAAADIYSPIAGTVVAINEDLADIPEAINSDPYGDAWMVKVKISDLGELDEQLDSEAYKKTIEDREA